MKRIRFRTAVGAVGGLLVLGAVGGLFVWSRTRWIPAGYVGVIYDASSGLQNRVLRPQAVLVGWRQQIYVYPTRIQNAIYSEDPDAGENRSADGIQVTTNDNATTVFDVVVTYRVQPESVVRVFNAFGPVPIEEIQTTQIRRATKEAANVVGTQYDLFTLMGPAREEASEKLTAELRKRLEPNGIAVEGAMLGSCYPSQELQQKITARVNGTIDLEISRLKRQIAEIERQVAVVKGEAESKARQISASGTKDRSLDMLKLDATEAAIDRWSGRLPAITPRAGQTIVIGNPGIAGVAK